MPDTDRTLGRAAYEAYWKAMGSGTPARIQATAAAWPRLTPQRRAAWEAAATAAVEASHA